MSTYKAVALRVFGSERHTRFVGIAMHRNPVLVEVPCHRVVKTDGEIGGYATGRDRKIELLKSENVFCYAKQNKVYIAEFKSVLFV